MRKKILLKDHLEMSTRLYHGVAAQPFFRTECYYIHAFIVNVNGIP